MDVIFLDWINLQLRHSCIYFLFISITFVSETELAKLIKHEY